MTDTNIIFGSFVCGFLVITSIIYFYRKSVKELKQTIDDKQIIINELKNYTNKVEKTQEDVVIKKPKPKVKKPTKKVEQTTKKTRKPKQK